MLECHVYQILSKKMIVGVLETGCVSEIDLKESMDEDTFERLAFQCNCFCPRIVGLSNDICWNSEKRRLQCSKLEYYLE